MSSMRKSNRKSKAKNASNNTNMLISHPPQFNSTISVSRKARFIGVSGAGTFNLTRAMLLNHLIMNSTNLLVNYRLLSGIKLNRVKIWSLGTGGLSLGAVNVSVEWTSTYGPSKIVSDSAMGVQAASVTSKPPKQSLASFWSLTGFNETDVIAIISAQVGAIIDIDYSIIFQNGETPVAVTTSNNGVAGTVYMTPLDGVGAAPHYLPVSYASNN